MASSHKYQVYSVAETGEGEGFNKVAENNHVIRDAMSFASNSALIESRNLQIVSIHPVAKTESKNVHLVAVTSNGFRLYFTTYSRSDRSINLDNPQSKVLELLHVRFPPERSPSDGGYGKLSVLPSKIHSSFYNQGVFIAASAFSDDEDSLLMTSINNAALSSMV